MNVEFTGKVVLTHQAPSQYLESVNLQILANVPKTS